MADRIAESYDRVPYHSTPRYATHPDCLATLATLLGMDPAPVARCRVLELGCSTGGNLISLAESLPGSQFVGIDLSAVQIDMGKQVIQALELENVRLETRSILDVDASFGQFDYIFCHGVYSWVPEAVREHLLEVCKKNLSPEGVAYVSYNTYPGWYLRAPVRDLMKYHIRDLADPREQVQQARAIVQGMAKHALDPESPWGKILEDESKLISKEGDFYLFHEHLAEHNHAVYFRDFIQHARRHGLQFLGESQSPTNLSVYSPEVQQILRDVSPDLLTLEQYVDFLKMRSFRRTLLIHEDVVLDRTPGPGIMQHFLVTGMARPTSAEPDVLSTAPEEFTTEDATSVSTAIPLVKAALVILFENWPRVYTFEELLELALGRLAGSTGGMTKEQAHGLLARSLVHLYLCQLVGLQTHMPAFVLEAGVRPRASAWTRLQARASNRLSNSRHKHVELGVFDRTVLGMLDGSRDRQALVETLVARVEADEVELRRHGKVLTEPGEIRQALLAELEEALERLGRALLLVE